MGFERSPPRFSTTAFLSKTATFLYKIGTVTATGSSGDFFLGGDRATQSPLSSVIIGNQLPTPYLPSPMITPTDPKLKALKRLRTLSHLLDTAIRIPGTRFRFGLDPLLGLLPAGGDIAGAFLSAYIVFSAARIGVPRESLVQMVSNILLETLIGTVPVVGDLFDAAWKANIRNMELLETHLDAPTSDKKADTLFIVLLLGGLILAVFAIVGVGIWILSSIISVILQ